MIQWQSIKCMINSGFALFFLLSFEIGVLCSFSFLNLLHCVFAVIGQSRFLRVVFFCFVLKTSISISNYRQTLLVSSKRATSCLSGVKMNEPYELSVSVCVLCIYRWARFISISICIATELCFFRAHVFFVSRLWSIYIKLDLLKLLTWHLGSIFSIL